MSRSLLSCSVGPGRRGGHCRGLSPLSVFCLCACLQCQPGEGRKKAKIVISCVSAAAFHFFMQDPVYGKGKLGEIQGLVLGMLDTFNYEQTLLETTTNLLNHDLHWSLCNLRASVTRGLTPKQDYCCICLQQYKRRQETADEIIVFSCGHLYHSLCLLSKECGTVTKGLMRWMCYKCNSSNKGGKLSENFSELKKGSGAPLAQTSSESLLDPQQIQAFDQLCRLNRGTSRLALLTELSRGHSSEKHGLLSISHGDPTTSSVFQNENFQLHLAPPPLAED